MHSSKHPPLTDPHKVGILRGDDVLWGNMWGHPLAFAIRRHPHTLFRWGHPLALARWGYPSYFLHIPAHCFLHLEVCSWHSGRLSKPNLIIFMCTVMESPHDYSVEFMAKYTLFYKRQLLWAESCWWLAFWKIVHVHVNVIVGVLVISN